MLSTAALEACCHALIKLQTNLKADGGLCSSGNAPQQLIVEHVHMLLVLGASSLSHMSIVCRPRIVEVTATMLQMAEQLPHSAALG